MGLNKFGMGFILSAKDNATSVFNKVGGGFSKMTSGVEKDARRQQNAMQSIAVGGAMVLFSKSLFDGFSNALSMSRELSTALAEVTTLTDEATFSAERMSKITAEAASKFGEDQVSQTKALYSIISAGFGEAEQAANLLNDANKMAVAGVSDVATSVDGLTNMMNNFKDKSSGAISDEMFTAVKAGKTTIDELAGSVGKLAPLWESLGGSSQSMLGAIATVTTKGIVTTEAISGLKAALQGVMKPTSDAQKEAKRLGVTFNIAALKSRGLVDVLEDVTRSSKFSDETFSKLFGSVEGLNAALALASNSSEKYHQIMEMMQDSQGATAEAFMKMTNTLAFQDKRFKVISDNIRRLFGASMERVLLPFAKVMVKVAEGFEKWLKSLPPEALDTLTTVVSVIGALVGLVGGLLILRGTMGLLGVSFSGVVQTMGTILVAGPLLILLFGGLGIAVYAAYRAFKKNTGGISMSWSEMVDKLKLAWQAVIHLIKGEEFSKELQTELGKAENKGLNKLIGGIERTIVRVKHFWKGMKAGFEEGIDRLSTSPAFVKLKDTFTSIFGIFTGSEMGDSQGQLDEWANKGVDAGLKIAKLGDYIFTAMTNVIEFGKRFAKSMEGVTADDVVQGINNVIDSFKTLMTFISGTIMVMGYLSDIVRVVFNSFQVVGALIAESIAAWITNLGKLGDVVSALLDMDFKRAGQAASEVNPLMLVPGPVGALAAAGSVIGDSQSETVKQAGDVVRVFDPTSTIGMEDKVKSKELSNLRGMQADTIGLIRQRRLKGQEAKDTIELLRQINAAMEANNNKPQPSINVLLDTSKVNSILDRHRESEDERELDSVPVVASF